MGTNYGLVGGGRLEHGARVRRGKTWGVKEQEEKTSKGGVVKS